MSKIDCVQPMEAELTGPATFAVDDAGHVLRRGLIFRAGRYDDKDFEVTRDELAIAAATAKFPIPVDLEHRSTILDSNLGELRGVELSADNTELWGLYAEPTWLNRLLGDKPRKVSCTWDRATKSLKGLALVNHPRVEDAVLMAAFSAAKPTTNEEPPMADEELDPVVARLKAMSPEDRKAALARLEGEPAGNDGGQQQQQQQQQSESAKTEFSAEVASLRAEAAEQRAEVQKLKVERRRQEAATFADKLVSTGRISVYQKSVAAAAMFTALADDDKAKDSDPIQFAQDGKTVNSTREGLVRTLYMQMPAKEHGVPRIPERDGDATFSGGQQPESDAEWAKRVVANTNGRNRIANASGKS